MGQVTQAKPENTATQTTGTADTSSSMARNATSGMSYAAGSKALSPTSTTTTSTTTAAPVSHDRAHTILAPFATFVPYSDTYVSLDETGLGRTLATSHRGDPALVRAVFDHLSFLDRDDVALAFVAAVDDKTLATLDRGLLGYLKEQLAGGYADSTETVQVGRVAIALGDTTAAAPTTTTPPAGGTKPAPSTDAPFADMTPEDRGKLLSTFKPEEITKVNKFGFSATARAAAMTREQWLTAKGITGICKGKSGQEYVDAVDAQVGAGGKSKFTEDQQKVLQSAKDFASSPKALSAAQEKNTLSWGKATLSLDGVTLNADLKARLEKYGRFLAWAGLTTGPSTAGSVMRSPKTAHKLSVAWMFNLGTNKGSKSSLHDAANRQKLVANVTAAGGSDQDGNAWLSTATVDGLKAKKDDDAALFDYIKTTAAPEANTVATQFAQAAEGYREPAQRHPNVLPGKSVSNHLLGEAVDMDVPWIFPNKFDPLIDAIAMYFGLFRAVKDSGDSPEHWHYERVGAPPGTEMP